MPTAEQNSVLAAFDQSTEAGRMLAAMYGGRKHPNIEYPKLHTKPSKGRNAENWRPGGAKAGAIDPRDATRRRVAVAAPRVGGGPRRKQWSAIDLAPKRRAEGGIREELEKMAMQSAAYRPAHTHSMADEKGRLGEINAYRGGKILPDEMTAPAMDMVPSETRRRAKEEKRVAEVRARRANGGVAPSAAAPAAVSKEAEMRSEIEREILERSAYIEQMTSLGKGRTMAVREVAAEIKQRERELQKRGLS